MPMLRNPGVRRAALALALLTAIASSYWWQRRPLSRTAAPTAESSSVPKRDSSENEQPLRSTSAASRDMRGSGVSAQISIQQQILGSKDWYALAKRRLKSAQAGDPEAQYILFLTYRGCTEGLTDHFQKFDTEEKAIQAARESGGSVKRAQERYDRCGGFYTRDAASLGDAWDWLQRATDAGYPPAQAETAKQRLAQDQLKASLRAGASPSDEVVHMPPIGGDADPRELLEAAVQTQDPEVLMAIGELQHILNPSQPADVIQLNSAAWRYAGCQRIGDCSRYYYGPATVTDCGPNDGTCVPVPEMLLRQVNYNWAPVADRVSQINEALSTKQWTQLPGLTTESDSR